MRESRKQVRRGVFLGLCLVAATVPAAIVYWRHTVPLSQCSEVYRRYRDLPGVQASFIHDKQINDTLSLDMTLFVAYDSLAFVNLLKGQIKLVGVRPLSQQYYDLYSEDLQQLRIKTKPGLLPPFYVDMPETLEEIQDSERRYLESYFAHPFRTDWKYFWKIAGNIVFRGKRSK